MDYNICHVRDQILALEFYFPCADFIYTRQQPDYSEQNLDPYATFTIHTYHIQYKIMLLSKYELGLQNFTFHLWSDTLKNGCFTVKQAPEVGKMLCHWARSCPCFKGSQ